MINGAEGALAVSEGVGGAAPESRRRGASSPPVAAPEKRKWPRDAPRPVTADDDDDDDTKVGAIYGSALVRKILSGFESYTRIFQRVDYLAKLFNIYHYTLHLCRPTTIVE